LTGLSGSGIYYAGGLDKRVRTTVDSNTIVSLVSSVTLIQGSIGIAISIYTEQE
jgi:hypothetical protein